MAHYPSVPQKRIPIELWPRSASMVTVASRGQKTVWRIDSELFCDLKPCSSYHGNGVTHKQKHVSLSGQDNSVRREGQVFILHGLECPGGKFCELRRGWGLSILTESKRIFSFPFPISYLDHFCVQALYS